MSNSLSTTKNFISGDVMRIEPALALEPENIRIGEYTFLPWVRSGFAAGLSAPAPGQVRAQLTASIDVQDDAGSAPMNVSKTLAVRGPGDVLDFDLSQIVRRYPQPGTTNAEDTFLVHVEFDRPEFPWLFSPFPAQNDQIPPWIALVVLEQAHAFIQPGVRGLPPVVRTRLGELQSLDNSWAWAHAQVVGGPEDPGPSVADRLTAAYGSVNLSRLLCPRTLSQNRAYIACIVPAFDVGVRVGLGQSGGTLDPAWTRSPGDDDHEIVLPVYDRWTFATTTDGDFKTLAERLNGVAAPWSVGRRTIDTSKPRGDVADLGPGAAGQLQVIRCALVAPSTIPKPPDSPDEDALWSVAKTEELRTQLNLPDTLATGGSHIDDLPLIGPTIYARFQRGQNNVTQTPGDWFPELNLLPTRRVVAGLGTRVIEKDREQLMQAAWAQVGEMEATNRDVRRAQFARFVGASLHARHFSALPVGDLAQISRGVHGKVRLAGSTLTVFGTVANSAVAPAALTAAFRRVARPQGPLSRYTSGAKLAVLQQIVATGTVFRDFRRAYVEPDGVATLSSSSVAAVSPAAASKVLGVAQKDALAELSKRAATLSRLPSSADQLLSDLATWKPTEATFDIGAIAAERTLAAVNLFMPASVSAQPSRAEGLAKVLVGVANSRTPEAKTATASVEAITKALPAGVAGASPAAPKVAPGVSTALQKFDSLTSRQLGMTLATSRTVTAVQLASELSQFVRGVGTIGLPFTPSRPPLALARDSLLASVHTRVTVTALIKARIRAFPSWLPADWFDDGLVRPIMAAPAFTRPMYEALDEYDRDWLIPGLSAVAQTDFVTLLDTNPVFTEAFLAGLSDEMGHELLVRGFPTDQRGTYFRRFWNADQDELAQDLHRFTQTPLGTHLNAAAGGSTQHLVFVVRGELIRRYPDALTFAMRAILPPPDPTHPTFIEPAPNNSNHALARILFHAHLSPDILLVGFDLTDADLSPGAWWFIIAEHPTAPRFSLPQGFVPNKGSHAASVAKTLLRDPVRAAFEASKLAASAKPKV
jgi:hypothetical protein